MEDGPAAPKTVDVVIIPVAFKRNNELGDCLDRAREAKVRRHSRHACTHFSLVRVMPEGFTLSLTHATRTHVGLGVWVPDDSSHDGIIMLD